MNLKKIAENIRNVAKNAGEDKAERVTMDFKKTFPSLFKVLTNLGFEMEMQPKKIIFYKKINSQTIRPWLNKLESQAKKLNSKKVDDPDKYSTKYSNEIELITEPQDDDAKILAKSKNLEELENFIGQTFDGKYTKQFMQ